MIDLLLKNQVIATHTRMKAVWAKDVTVQLEQRPAGIACTAYYKGKSPTLDHMVASVAILELIQTGQVTGYCARVG